MNIIRRSVTSLLTPSGYQRALILATFDDSFAIQETDLEAVLQGLIGGQGSISEHEAYDLYARRIRDEWTWKVVLKILIIFHNVLRSSRTTVRWLQHFVSKTNILNVCLAFREGEGTDLQAATHSPVIRHYAAFLTLFSHDIIHNPNSYIKGYKLSNRMFRSYDDEELLKIILSLSHLLQKCISPFIIDTKIAVIEGFCKLTACAATLLLKEALSIYSLLSTAGLELLERYPKLHPNDLPLATKVYEVYRQSSNQLQAYLFFVKKLPELSSTLLPEFTTPPPAPILTPTLSKNRFVENSYHTISEAIPPFDPIKLQHVNLLDDYDILQKTQSNHYMSEVHQSNTYVSHLNPDAKTIHTEHQCNNKHIRLSDILTFTSDTDTSILIDELPIPVVEQSTINSIHILEPDIQQHTTKQIDLLRDSNDNEDLNGNQTNVLLLHQHDVFIPHQDSTHNNLTNQFIGNTTMSSPLVPMMTSSNYHQYKQHVNQTISYKTNIQSPGTSPPVCISDIPLPPYPHPTQLICQNTHNMGGP